MATHVEIPAIFQLPSERPQGSRDASPEIQAQQVAYQSRPWAACVHDSWGGGTHKFDSLTETLEYVRQQAARKSRDFGYYLTGPGGRLDDATAHALLAAHCAKKGRPATPAEVDKACADLREKIKLAPWHQTTFTVTVPPRLAQPAPRYAASDVFGPGA